MRASERVGDLLSPCRHLLDWQRLLARCVRRAAASINPSPRNECPCLAAFRRFRHADWFHRGFCFGFSIYEPVHSPGILGHPPRAKHLQRQLRSSLCPSPGKLRPCRPGQGGSDAIVARCCRLPLATGSIIRFDVIAIALSPPERHAIIRRDTCFALDFGIASPRPRRGSPYLPGGRVAPLARPSRSSASKALPDHSDSRSQCMPSLEPARAWSFAAGGSPSVASRSYAFSTSCCTISGGTSQSPQPPRCPSITRHSRRSAPARRQWSGPAPVFSSLKGIVPRFPRQLAAQKSESRNPTCRELRGSIVVSALNRMRLLNRKSVDLGFQGLRSASRASTSYSRERLPAHERGSAAQWRAVEQSTSHPARAVPSAESRAKIREAPKSSRRVPRAISTTAPATPPPPVGGCSSFPDGIAPTGESGSIPRATGRQTPAPACELRDGRRLGRNSWADMLSTRPSMGADRNPGCQVQVGNWSGWKRRGLQSQEFIFRPCSFSIEMPPIRRIQ